MSTEMLVFTVQYKKHTFSYLLFCTADLQSDLLCSTTLSYTHLLYSIKPASTRNLLCSMLHTFAHYLLYEVRHQLRRTHCTVWHPCITMLAVWCATLASLMFLDLEKLAFCTGRLYCTRVDLKTRQSIYFLKLIHIVILIKRFQLGNFMDRCHMPADILIDYLLHSPEWLLWRRLRRTFGVQ